MQIKTLATTLLAALAIAAPTLASAADEDKDQKPANQQVIVPQVDRRNIKPPKFPSNDFELGLFAGSYATQNFGTSLVTGLRLGYHITEDFFIEGVYGQTKVSDEAFSHTLPAPILDDDKLNYYNISAGVNLLPGEVFIGRNYAKASALYFIAGVGSTKFNRQRKQTVNFGFGSRVLLADWAAVQIDLRDHMFELDLLGKRERTQNIEFTLGLTFFF